MNKKEELDSLIKNELIYRGRKAMKERLHQISKEEKESIMTEGDTILAQLSRAAFGHHNELPNNPLPISDETITEFLKGSGKEACKIKSNLKKNTKGSKESSVSTKRGKKESSNI